VVPDGAQALPGAMVIDKRVQLQLQRHPSQRVVVLTSLEIVEELINVAGIMSVMVKGLVRVGDGVKGLLVAEGCPLFRKLLSCRRKDV